MSPFPSHRCAAALAVALGLIVAAVGSGCFDASSCAEIGCEDDLVCNEASGECEEVDRSCEQTGCPSGQTCDESSGACRSQGVECAEDSCPSRQVCNAQTGYCQARGDCQTAECRSPAEECDAATGQCVPRSCDEDDECGEGHHCSNDGECRPGCRPGRRDACPDGEFCRADSGETIGECREHCQSDEECPLGLICEEADDGASCEREPACETDDDCRGDGVCIDDLCQPPPCDSNDTCGDEQVCDRSTGRCVAADCDDDFLAPNQTRREAAALHFESYTDLTLCAGTSDWFELSVSRAQAIELRLEHRPEADLDIAAYDEHNRLIAANQQTGPASTLAFISEQDQTVTIEVSAQTDRNETYDLRARRAPQASCEDDAAEPNDHPGQATGLPTDTDETFESQYAICGGDEDWFALPDLSADNRLEVTTLEADDHIALELYTPDGDTLTAEANESLELARLGADGDYLLRVHSRRAESGSYRLETRVRRSMTCMEVAKHDSPDEARFVASNSVHALPLCPLDNRWDRHWLQLDGADDRDNRLVAQIVAAEDLPKLDVDLYAQTDRGDTPERVRSATLEGETYHVRAALDPQQTYFLRVAAAGQPGRVLDDVDYQLFYRFDPSDS